MQVNETLNEGLKRKLDLSIPATELSEKLEEKLNELKDQVRLKGFRPGKVPFAHLKRVYGRSAMSEVMRDAMNSGIRQTLEERAERPAQQPEIDLTDDEAVIDKIFAGEADLDFSVSYEVLPKVELMDLTKIEVERPVVEVGEEEIASEFQRFVETNRPFETKDGPAAAGDRVTMDYVGRIDGAPFEGGAAEGAQVVIGQGQLIEGFEEQLAGAGAGETRDVTVTFPDDYSAAELAGKSAVFEVSVSAVETPSTAEIDDEFARAMGAESLDKLRQAVREQIEEQYRNLGARRVTRLVLDALDEGHKFELPDKLVESEFNTIWERVMHEVEHHGRSFEAEGTTEEEARAEYRKIAERRVRLGLVVAEVGSRHEIQVTDEELQQALLAEVQRYPGQEQQVYDYYRENPQALAGLRAPLFERKVVGFIAGQAKVTDKTVGREELMALVEADQSGPEVPEPHDHHDHGEDSDHSDHSDHADHGEDHAHDEEDHA